LTNTTNDRVEPTQPLCDHRWLTVVSRDDPDGTELVLEPDIHQGVHGGAGQRRHPYTSFAMDEVGATLLGWSG
jgi:hypothetical protein